MLCMPVRVQWQMPTADNEQVGVDNLPIPAVSENDQHATFQAPSPVAS
jgi:hypothetical protein